MNDQIKALIKQYYINNPFQPYLNIYVWKSSITHILKLNDLDYIESDYFEWSVGDRTYTIPYFIFELCERTLESVQDQVSKINSGYEFLIPYAKKIGLNSPRDLILEYLNDGLYYSDFSEGMVTDHVWNYSIGRWMKTDCMKKLVKDLKIKREYKKK